MIFYYYNSKNNHIFGEGIWSDVVTDATTKFVIDFGVPDDSSDAIQENAFSLSARENLINDTGHCEYYFCRYLCLRK